MRKKSNFIKGSVEILILQILLDGECYGYEIAQRISKYSDGELEIPEGSLYPALYKLSERGYLSEDKRLTGKRKSVIRIYYKIEESGRAYLEQQITEYNRVHSAIQKVLNKNNE